MAMSMEDWFLHVKTGNLAGIRELISGGADVDYRDQRGWCALHIAAWQGLVDVAKLLIDANGDPNMAAVGGITPLILAVHKNHEAVVRLLIHANCNKDSTASFGGSVGVTALHAAAYNGSSQIVKLLVDAGANINIGKTTGGISGITPLHVAVEQGHLDIMDILLTAGCDVHSSTQSRFHPETDC